MGTWKNYIEHRKKKYIGKKVLFENNIYTIVDVDYNGSFLIDKPARFTDTTAVGHEHIEFIWSTQNRPGSVIPEKLLIVYFIGGNFMQINLSEETIKTVYKALKSEKNTLQGMLRRIEVGTAAKEKKEIFEQQLVEVDDALQVFEELSK